MIHMTLTTRRSRYVVLGAELLNEFRRNGSANSIQQMIVNKSDGYIWLSEEDYRGCIKADEVYLITFEECGEVGYQIPIFFLEASPKIVNKEIHRDPFPNAIPEIRYAYKFDGVICTTEPQYIDAKEICSVYDGCK